MFLFLTFQRPFEIMKLIYCRSSVFSKIWILLLKTLWQHLKKVSKKSPKIDEKSHFEKNKHCLKYLKNSKFWKFFLIFSEFKNTFFVWYRRRSHWAFHGRRWPDWAFPLVNGRCRTSTVNVHYYWCFHHALVANPNTPFSTQSTTPSRVV